MVDNATYYYRARKYGNGWHLSHLYVLPGLKRYVSIVDQNLSASEINISLSELKQYLDKNGNNHFYCVPYYLDLTEPGEWYQVVYVCNRSCDDLKTKLQQRHNDICGRYLANYNWLHEIPQEEIRMMH